MPACCTRNFIATYLVNGEKAMADISQAVKSNPIPTRFLPPVPSWTASATETLLSGLKHSCRWSGSRTPWSVLSCFVASQKLALLDIRDWSVAGRRDADMLPGAHGWPCSEPWGPWSKNWRCCAHGILSVSCAVRSHPGYGCNTFKV